MPGGIDEDGFPYHFRLAGLPVYVEWPFFVLAVVLGPPDVGLLLLWILVLFASVLVHEVGHALACRAFGIPAGIRLVLWGGVTTHPRAPDRRWKDAAISAAGPVPPLLLIGLPALAALAAGVGEDDDGLRSLLTYVVVANVGYSLFNMLPLLPMDGGRLVQATWGLLPARIASAATASLGCLLAVAVGSPRWAVYGLAAAGYNLWKLRQERAAGLTDDPVRRLTRQARRDAGVGRRGTVAPSDLAMAWDALAEGDVADAEKAARAATHRGEPVPDLLVAAIDALRGRSSEAVVGYRDALLAGGTIPAAADAVLVRCDLVPDVALALAHSDDARAATARADLVRRLVDRGHGQRAGEVAEVLARAAGDDAGRAWYDAARTWARAGDAPRAVAALRWSAASGHADSSMVVGDPAFSPLFDQPTFAADVRTLGTPDPA